MKYMDPIEITNEVLTKELFDRVEFLSIAEGGAMGEPGGVQFFTSDGTFYHFNTLYGGVSFDRFEKVFPVITECDFGMFGIGSEVASGWVYVNLGAGNHLIVKDSVYPAFEEKIGVFDRASRVYSVWVQTAYKVLKERNSGKRHIGKKERIEVFEDTQKWIKQDSDLSRSVAVAKKRTEVFYEDDYPAFDARKRMEEKITITKERSFQFVMVSGTNVFLTQTCLSNLL